MEIQLRELKSVDVFPMFGILSKIGFKDLKEELTPERMKEITAVFKEDDSAEDMTMYLGFNVVLDVVQIIMKNLPSCEQEIYKFLAGLSGMTEKQIKNLDMVTFTEMIIAVVQKEEFKDFFKVVSRLFK